MQRQMIVILQKSFSDQKPPQIAGVPACFDSSFGLWGHEDVDGEGAGEGGERPLRELLLWTPLCHSLPKLSRKSDLRLLLQAGIYNPKL